MSISSASAGSFNQCCYLSPSARFDLYSFGSICIHSVRFIELDRFVLIRFDWIDLYWFGLILYSFGSICIHSDRFVLFGSICIVSVRFVLFRIDLYSFGSICIHSDRFASIRIGLIIRLICIVSVRFVLFRFDLYCFGSICIHLDRFVIIWIDLYWFGSNTIVRIDL